MKVKGTLVQGYGVASAPSRDYPYGTLEKQRPFFAERGLDLSAYFNGTLNIDIHPFEFKILRPEFTFPHVEWTDLHPPEDFSFSRCTVTFKAVDYDGWLYYPHPETKLRHFQNPSLLEVIAVPIAGIQYGDGVELNVNEDEMEIRAPGGQ
jgi:hypothetical protein